MTSIKNEHILKKQREFAEFKKTVLQTVTQIAELTGQPVTVSEVRQYLLLRNGSEQNDFRVRNAMNTLLSDGYLRVRTETDSERSLRFNGRTAFAGNAVLFYPAAIAGDVPERTVAVIAPGIEIKGWTQAPGRRAGSKNRKRATRRVAARGASPEVTGTPGHGFDKAAVDFLVEKLVQARTVELQKELAEANRQLAEIRALLT